MKSNILVTMGILLLLTLLFSCALFGQYCPSFPIFNHFFMQPKFKEGMTSSSSVTYTSDNGSTATLDNDKSITVTNADGSSTTYTANTSQSANTGINLIYTSPSGATAAVSPTINGENNIVVTDPSGQSVTVFRPSTNTATHISKDSGIAKYSHDNYNHFDQSYYPTIFYGPNGSTARVIRNGSGEMLIFTTTSGGQNNVYYIDANKSGDINTAQYTGKNGGHANIIWDDSTGAYVAKVITPDGQTYIYHEHNDQSAGDNDGTSTDTTADANDAYIYTNNNYSSITGPDGNTVHTYSTTLPPGIPRSAIPKGQEDLYILKSEIVPAPVVCEPQIVTVYKDAECPPCPPCQRMEMNYDCVKIPKYSEIPTDQQPNPNLVDDYVGFAL